MQQRQQDIKKILSQGCNALDSATIAEVLNIPVQTVEMEKAYIDREEQMKREFLATSQLPEHPRQMAHFTIYQS